MTTQTQTATPTTTKSEQEQTVEEKIQQMRALFADAPEVGKTALKNVLQRLAPDGSEAGWARSQS